MPAGQRVSQCAAIDVLELAAHWDAVRDAGSAHTDTRGDFGEEVSGRFAFDGWIGGEDHLAHLAFAQQLLE